MKIWTGKGIWNKREKLEAPFFLTSFITEKDMKDLKDFEQKNFIALDDLKEKISELRFNADIVGLQDTEITLQELEKSLGLEVKL